VGGVETAARSISHYSEVGLSFEVDTIFPPLLNSHRLGLLNFRPFLYCLLRLLKKNPSILVVSLWRAYALGLLFKLMRPSTKLVVFLHLPSSVHLIDRFLTFFAAIFAHRVWADSQETLAHRIPWLPQRKGTVISFVTKRIFEPPSRPVQPVFIFWGRIHKQKRLEHSLYLFKAIHSHFPLAKFFIIGPDGGDLSTVRKIVYDLNLVDSVEFLGSRNFEQISAAASIASFYLQTSVTEGMAMSVVEAMQLGLVPITTPVGEIKHYALQNWNAIIIKDRSSTVVEVLSLLSDNNRYQLLRKNAIKTWVDRPLYRDSIINACREL
jgi:glycosyltransferase involved in cell wall biosynthesis